MLWTARTTDDGGLDEGEIHDVLRNDRRRVALEVLQERGGRASVRELAEAIATDETSQEPAPRNKRQSVYVSLHQTHLPKLDELGIVSYDADEKEVSLDDRVQEVEVYMEVVPKYGITWGEFYLGLALLGLLTTVSVLVGVPGVSSVQLATVAVGFFALLTASAAYHVYSSQNRTVVHRLLERDDGR